LGLRVCWRAGIRVGRRHGVVRAASIAFGLMAKELAAAL